MAYFPVFIELNNRPCLVVGGGRVALRKVQVLRDFGASVTVTAREICEEIRCISGVCCRIKEYTDEDLDGMELVVAATDDPEKNHAVSQACRARQILVNAVDQKEDCDFIFPSYIKEGEVVAAFSSGGQSPVVTQYLKRRNQSLVTEELGRLTECLGSLRDEVKERVAGETGRKKVYEEILRLGLEKEAVPEGDEIEQVIVRQERNDTIGSYKTIENK